MGDKKTRKGLDTLRGDIQGLTEVVADLRDKLTTQHALSSAEHFAGSYGSPIALSSLTREIETHARAARESGSISAFGYFEGAGNGEDAHVFRWSMEERPVKAILGGPITQYAHMLAAIGHPQRLNILLMLLEEPATANDVVSELSLGTTGAAYHHLNVLQAAGFVEQQHRGIFTIVPQRIPALLTILASLSNGMAVEILDDLPEEEQPEDEEDTDPIEGISEIPQSFMLDGNHKEAISGPAA